MEWGIGNPDSRPAADRSDVAAVAAGGSQTVTLTVPAEALAVLEDALMRHYRSVYTTGHDRSLTALLLLRVEQARGEGK